MAECGGVVGGEGAGGGLNIGGKGLSLSCRVSQWSVGGGAL